MILLTARLLKSISSFHKGCASCWTGSPFGDLPSPDQSAQKSVTPGEAPCPGDRWCDDPGVWEISSQQLCRPSSTAVTISLDAALPQSSPSIGSSVTIPFVNGGDLRTSLTNASWCLSPSLPEGMKVHRSTAIEFLQYDHCPSGEIDVPFARHELYIDGSASLEHCAWALIHVYRYADGTRKFAGLLAGNVVLSPEDPHWIGAQYLDNISAELTAMTVAYAFAISLQQSCCICPDLRFGQDLVRRQVTNKDNLVLAKLCTALGRLHHVPVEEVRAHRGDPYNELADCTAKWAGRHGLAIGSFDWSHLRGLVSSTCDLDWTWISNCGLPFQLVLPSVDDAGCLHVQPASDRVSVPDKPRPTAPQETSLIFSLRVATANVQSAREKSSGTGVRSAALTKRFDQQWYQHQIDIIGAQEARTPQGQDLSPHYAIYCSGVDVSKGSAHFGCEIKASQRCGYRSRC